MHRDPTETNYFFFFPSRSILMEKVNGFQSVITTVTPNICYLIQVLSSYQQVIDCYQYLVFTSFGMSRLHEG